MYDLSVLSEPVSIAAGTWILGDVFTYLVLYKSKRDIRRFEPERAEKFEKQLKEGGFDFFYYVIPPFFNVARVIYKSWRKMQNTKENMI